MHAELLEPYQLAPLDGSPVKLKFRKARLLIVHDAWENKSSRKDLENLLVAIMACLS